MDFFKCNVRVSVRIISAIVLVAFASMFVSCSSKVFMKSYESFVVSVEKAAEKGQTNKLESFQAKAEKFKEKARKLEKSGNWTKEDEVSYAKLSGRLALAMSKLSVSKAADSVSNAIKGIGDKLKK
ncbi:MAG: hypothetical protein IJP61_06635 [Treponema sp.]|nr:hypothetical protein [Treponema sp.]